MKISIINGSPKIGKSTSALLIEYLLAILQETSPQHIAPEIKTHHINQSALTAAQISDIQNSDALIFAFPLYIDSIPAHLLRQLSVLAQEGFHGKEKKVYCIVNNGFYEGTQNRVAVEQMKLWCESVHLSWGQAIGTGAGEMYPLIKQIPLGYGPNKNIGCALHDFARNILTQSIGTDRFISVHWPRFLWKIQASALVWYPRAKANGLKRKEMRRKMEQSG